MEMSGPTKNQLNFIKKLRDAGFEREEKLQQYLKEKGKSDVSDLSIKEASELIDALKQVNVAGENRDVPYATGKQISFLANLQSNEKNQEVMEKYLKEKSKTSINLLTMQEASELIEKLKALRSTDNTNVANKLATKKQIQFIKNLQNTDKKMEIARKYLMDLNKKNLEELTSREASGLIDRLRDGKK